MKMIWITKYVCYKIQLLKNKKKNTICLQTIGCHPDWNSCFYTTVNLTVDKRVF